MRNFQDTPESHKRSFISSSSIWMTVPLIFEFFDDIGNKRYGCDENVSYKTVSNGRRAS